MSEKNIIVRNIYEIEGELLNEALLYAQMSKKFTSDRHDFHAGGLNNKQQKMLEGKLGEKAVKMFFIDNKISFVEDDTPYYKRDEYDFLVFKNEQSLKVDVKTRTKSFHVRTLEMVEQANSHPKDIYISTRLLEKSTKVKILGWFSFDDMVTKNRVENLGYLDNYVMYDNDLRPMEEFAQFLTQ